MIDVERLECPRCEESTPHGTGYAEVRFVDGRTQRWVRCLRCGLEHTPGPAREEETTCA